MQRDGRAEKMESRQKAKGRREKEEKIEGIQK